MGSETDYNSTWDSSDDMPNNTWDPRDDMPRKLGKNIIQSFTCVVCILGLLGNGAVIWLLGFRLKRNPFTTYILNLAVADFGVLIALTSAVVLDIVTSNVVVFDTLDFFRLLPLYLHIVSIWLFHFAYSTSQFLLTAISIDRCVAVFFPLWYRCHRPEKFPSVLCALIWLLSFLVNGLWLRLLITWRYNTFPLAFYAVLVTAVVCLPLITVSTLILSFRFCFKPQQRQRGKLLTAILLALFFFLIFAFPLDVICLISFDPRSSWKVRFNLERYVVGEYGLLSASLNSLVNPLLYFFIGRKKTGLCRENLMLVLRRVFLEEKEEACQEEPET